jgi:hypothetical protein
MAKKPLLKQAKSKTNLKSKQNVCEKNLKIEDCLENLFVKINLVV